jgi:2-polyprenyl-3-methyl-5-hydroxy-6-metoxy-1,4-benzoquinol methylase
VSVQEKVQAFYGETPFPYDLDAYGPWRQPAIDLLRNVGLDPEVVRGKKLLDAGCGTGAFSRSFAALGADVTAIDITPASIQRARELDGLAGVDGVDYRPMSVFDPPREAPFDIVASLGVLHHTPDPLRGFFAISSVVKPGGLLIVGLYSPISRAHILATRAAIKLLSRGDERTEYRFAGSKLLRTLRVRSVGEQNADQPARIRDLLVHPNEKPVLAQDALQWFGRAGFDVIGSDPGLRLAEYPWLRRVRWLPRGVQYSLIQLRWLTWLADYYVIAGRRRSD